MTSEPRFAPSARDRFTPPAVDANGYPNILSALDPCWSLFAAGWPGLTTDEAAEIVRKTRSPQGVTA